MQLLTVASVAVDELGFEPELDIIGQLYQRKQLSRLSSNALLFFNVAIVVECIQFECE